MYVLCGFEPLAYIATFIFAFLAAMAMVPFLLGVRANREEVKEIDKEARAAEEPTGDPTEMDPSMGTSPAHTDD